MRAPGSFDPLGELSVRNRLAKQFCMLFLAISIAGSFSAQAQDQGATSGGASRAQAVADAEQEKAKHLAPQEPPKGERKFDHIEKDIRGPIFSRATIYPAGPVGGSPNVEYIRRRIDQEVVWGGKLFRFPRPGERSSRNKGRWGVPKFRLGLVLRRRTGFQQEQQDRFRPGVYDHAHFRAGSLLRSEIDGGLHRGRIAGACWSGRS